ncbi:hypothetical protein AV530_014541 [Patagioenas fasciata monilis]|uniref:Uncharacterized protein n=1 Tax=Patagioenas fasciata monilis TaxID=372326 RepID=A0A1V4KC46_PATFA|nr:hypothetical protein AV530_014541 [Patagioenas fasciata monilis]
MYRGRGVQRSDPSGSGWALLSQPWRPCLHGDSHRRQRLLGFPGRFPARRFAIRRKPGSFRRREPSQKILNKIIFELSVPVSSETDTRLDHKSSLEWGL